MANSSGALLTVSQARALLGAGFQALEKRKQEINDLNVYPVPDGDTGTNLALTMRGIIDSVARLPPGLPEAELCAAISQAALMGARGNSGVILSQIVRGAMEVIGRPGPITSNTLTRAFRHATDTAYRAVRRPVEGTMLTVLREMAEAAAMAPEAADPRAFMNRVVAAGWKSVERTPSLLRVLADAGVVDAGGYGLVVLVEGAANGRSDWQTPIATRIERTLVFEGMFLEGASYEEEENGTESRFDYCTSFLITGQALDRASLEEKLSRLGDSLLVVGDSSRLKVHVHTDDPGQVIGLATSLGALTEIEIDNMKVQIAARDERLLQVAGSALVDPGITQVVAVVAGEGNKALFRNLGVDFIVDGGQSMNPSAEDLMRAVEEATAPSIIILPNNSNVVMTADQTVKLTERDVLVVPTRSIQAGLSAAVAYDKRRPGPENVLEMRAALDNVITAEVTQAVRDSRVDGVQINAQDFIGLVEDQVVVASHDLGRVVEEVVARLLDGGREMLTALVGDDDNAAQAAEVVDHVRTHYPGVEVDMHEGGQPFYPLLLSAE
ncbi:MAG: DAK2 domain-containing protein [bacterium]